MNQITSHEKKRRNIFNLINLLFWAIWVAVPFYIASSTQYWNEAIIFSGLENGCKETAPTKLSHHGEIAASIFFVIDTLIYLTLFGLMHFLVNDCAKGRFLISRTISVMGYIAAIVILWPIFSLISYNLTKYYLFLIGDIPHTNPDYQIDIIMIGAGFFFIVIRYILIHALKMQEEAKLVV